MYNKIYYTLHIYTAIAIYIYITLKEFSNCFDYLQKKEIQIF